MYMYVENMHSMSPQCIEYAVMLSILFNRSQFAVFKYCFAQVSIIIITVYQNYSTSVSNPLAKFYTKKFVIQKPIEWQASLTVQGSFTLNHCPTIEYYQDSTLVQVYNARFFILVSQKKLQTPYAQTAGKPDTIEHDVLLMRRVKFANKRDIFPGKRTVHISNNRNILHLFVDQRMCYQIFIHVNWIYVESIINLRSTHFNI